MQLVRLYPRHQGGNPADMIQKSKTGKNKAMNKKLILVTSLSSILAGFSPARAAADYITTVESTPNLLGYWRYSSASQANSEVNGYTGTLNGGAAVGPAGSGPALGVDPANSALLLNGTSSFVSTNLTGQIGGAGSIIGWFKLNVLPSTSGHIFYIAGESQVGNDFDVQINTDDTLRFYTEAGPSTGTLPFTNADLNVWHFFAATYLASSARNIYLDGVLAATAVPGGHGLNTSAFNMGASDVFGGRFFDGQLDEIAIFNRDLSPTEVGNIYGSTPVVPEPSTIGLLAVGCAFSIGTRRGRKGI